MPHLFTVQADSGSPTPRGIPELPPFQLGGRIVEWVAGAYAGVGAMGAVHRARATGHGELVDVSWCEVANLTASRLALKTERRLRVFSEDAYVSIDYQKKYGIVARRSGNLAAIRDAVAKIRSGEIEDLSDLNYHDLVQIEELQIDDQEPIRAEIESFLNALSTNSRPPIPAEDGLAAVETAERIVAAIPKQELK